MMGEEGIKSPGWGQSCSASLAVLFSVKLQENDSVHPCVYRIRNLNKSMWKRGEERASQEITIHHE